MSRPRIRAHIVLVLVWVGGGVALLLMTLDALDLGDDEKALAMVPAFFLWGLFGGLSFYYYRKYRGSKKPSEYGLAQFLHEYDWPDW